MCSILKINKDLISIVRGYLSPDIKQKYKRMLTYTSPLRKINIFSRHYYLYQLKKRFPQKHYKIRGNIILFEIKNLKNIRCVDPVFNDINIEHYIHTNLDSDEIYFIMLDIR